MNVYPRLVIAGTHSGVGKTTVTLALLAALKARGRSVQAFKVGPDFIDPGHHRLVTGRPSRNLDGWMLGEAENRKLFKRAATNADLSIIEGMMGLFDGCSPVHEAGSTAELAKQLAAPVLLVVDAGAMARSVAAMVTGYANFDRGLHVAGVLFNRVGSDGHYRLLKEAVESETTVDVIGYLKSDPTLTIAERHLGLVTAIAQESRVLYDRLRNAAMETVHLDRVEALARSAGALPSAEGGQSSVSMRERTVRVGLAYDSAFCFYYEDNLDVLKAEGAELVEFSPLTDRELPQVDMLYLGGGYPELYAKRLAANVAMRQAVRSFAEAGGAVYAECGGMMYLTESIRDFEGQRHDMVGLFPAEAVMGRAAMTLGYRELRLSEACLLGAAGTSVRGHEFHYSTLEAHGPLHYAGALKDAQGNDKGPDGLVYRNTLAFYSHLHFGNLPALARSFIAAAQMRVESR
jgi:cobyrinic acid a,c-diamide synthase